MAEIVFVLLIAALAAWIYLLTFHGDFWRANQILPGDGDKSVDNPEPGDKAVDKRVDEAVDEMGETLIGATAWPGVVACIPARDEADVIEGTIRSHMAMDYPGAYSVVLADDSSSDGTGAKAEQAAAGGPVPLLVTQAPPLTAGWTGKLHALHYAISIAADAAPDAKYVLLTDADIRYRPGVVTRLVRKAEREGRSLVSIMAMLDARGLWASLLIPAFVFFFQKLYPFPSINNPRSKVAGAAGGCVLVERQALAAEGGLGAIRGALIDDCALARLIKGRPPKRSIWLGLSHDVISQRDNRRLGDIWTMVARTAFTQLNYSWALLLGCVIGMVWLYLAGPVAVLMWPAHGSAVLGGLGLAVWVLMAVSYLPMLRWYKDELAGGPGVVPRLGYALALPFSAALYTAMTLSSGLRHVRGQGGFWKGRAYSRDQFDSKP